MRSAILTGVLAMLGACASSPDVRYYRLDPASAPPSAVRDVGAAGPAVLAIGPLQFPDYLRRDQIVTRGPGARLIIDDFHRWAEPLDHAATRALAAAVDARLTVMVAVPAPGASDFPVDFRLVGNVVRFEAGSDGQAELQVQWGIRAPGGGNVVVAARSSDYAGTRAGTDPEAIARSMADALDQFADDIVRALAEAR